MTASFRCLQGHEWSSEFDKPSNPGEEPTCPICGTVSQTIPPHSATTRGEGIEPLEPGELPTIPGYWISERLGEGAMGVVYRAHQIELDRVVALKVIRAGEHAGSKELKRFQDEAQVVARLKHPNIVPIFEIGRCRGQPYFTLECVT